VTLDRFEAENLTHGAKFAYRQADDRVREAVRVLHPVLRLAVDSKRAERVHGKRLLTGHQVYRYTIPEYQLRIDFYFTNDRAHAIILEIVHPV
jgi:hypothetical protein